MQIERERPVNALRPVERDLLEIHSSLQPTTYRRTWC